MLLKTRHPTEEKEDQNTRKAALDRNNHSGGRETKRRSLDIGDKEHRYEKTCR